MSDVKIDSNNIEEMYIKYYTPLKRYCIKLVSYNSRYTAIAEDCVQEAFLSCGLSGRGFCIQSEPVWLAGYLLLALYAVTHPASEEA